ncbi:MAG: hypothetical protein ACP5NV_02630 [Candidatus Woesearchaeota archaeon]
MKKAQMGTIVTLIIVVVIAILLITLGYLIFTDYSGKGEIETCRLSVLTQSNTEVPIVGASPLSLECKKRFVNIYKNKVEIGTDPEKTSVVNVYTSSGKKKSFNTLNNDIINSVVAEEMKTCWYQFGEAKINVFPNDESLTEAGGDLLGAEDDICFTCSEIKFENIPGIEFSGLIDHLKNTNVPKTKYTYWDYFNQESLSEHTLQEYMEACYPDTVKDLWDDKPFIFNSDETYSVIFYKDYDDSISNMVKFYNIYYTAGKAAGFIINDNCVDTGGKSGYYVLVVPTKNLDDICEKQAS